MRTIAIAVAAAVATLPAGPAFAQDLALAAEQCSGDPEATAPEDQIDACTILIDSGALRTQDLPHAYVMRGWAYLLVGVPERAREDFSEAIRRSPRMADAYGWRGAAYGELGDHAHAVEDLTEALRLAPRGENTAMWHEGRGVSYVWLGDWDSAVADYSKAIALEPGDAELYLQRGNAYGEQPNFAAAIEDLSHATRLAPDMATAWNNLCWTRATSGGDPEQALAECDRAIALEPAAAAFLDSRGVVHLKRGDWQAAVADFDAAILVDPSFGSSFYGRGLAYMRLGETDLARVDMAQAAAIDPETATDYAGYGLAP